MKHHMKKANRNDLMMLYILVMLGIAILFSIAIYGMEARATAKETKFQERIQEIDIQESAREEEREQEWAEARQELHEYFYEQKMEKARAKAEDFQTNAVILQDFHEEFDQVIKTSKLEVLETVKEETEEPETMEETEDNITEQKIFFEEPEKKIGEPLFVEAEITRFKAEKEIEEDDWFEIQPVVEAQPQVKQIPTPSVNTVEGTTKEFTTGISVEEFLHINGISLDDLFIKFTCVVYAEAQGEEYLGKQSVAATLFNWIRHQNKEPERGSNLEYLIGGYAKISYDEYQWIKWHGKDTDRQMLQDCEKAVQEAYNGIDLVEGMLGVKPFYFFKEEGSDPINIFIMSQATYKITIGEHWVLGIDGVDWSIKYN